MTIDNAVETDERTTLEFNNLFNINHYSQDFKGNPHFRVRQLVEDKMGKKFKVTKIESDIPGTTGDNKLRINHYYTLRETLSSTLHRYLERTLFGDL